MRITLFSFLLLAVLFAGGQASAAVFDPVTPGGGGLSRATVTVITHVINDDGGTLLPAHFLMTYGDGLSVLSTWAGMDFPGTFLTVPPEAYMVEGSNQPWYARSYSLGCSGTLIPNGAVTCTVTYDDVPVGTPGCEQGCSAPPSDPSNGCVVQSCQPVPPAQPDAQPPQPDTTPVPSEPMDGQGGPPPSEDGGGTGGEELPRTGGVSFALAIGFAALGTVLSLRKRS